MAWHHIDAPTKRSLSWMEQKVHDLLWEGLTPEQIAVKCKRPLRKGWSLSGDAPDSIYDIMSRIREKGHELPVINNKEDEDVKYTDKQKEKALQLYEQGMKLSEIASKLKINYKTLCKWVSDYKKQKAKEEEEMWNQAFEDSKLDALCEDGTPPCEVTPDTDMEEYEKAWAEYEAKKEEPASAATDTDSGEKHFGNVSDPIIPENIEPVKSRYFSADTITAIEDKIAVLSAEQNKITERMLNKYAAIDKINASIAEDDALNCGIQFRIDELKADLDVIRGGVVSE